MTTNDFNSKINLPALCLALGIKGFEFKKIPKFGWYAFTPDRKVVLNLFQLLPEDQRTKAYRFLTIDQPSYQESKMYYSEVSENKLKSNYLYTCAWQAFLNASLLEAKEGRLFVKGQRVKLQSVLNEVGLPLLLNNNVGLVNDRILSLKEFKLLNLHESYNNKLIVPSYATPFHPCSYEIVDPFDLNKRQMAWLNREKGWYGKLGHCIVNDIPALGIQNGNTWDYKCDFWNNGVIDLSSTLNEEQCITIWTEANQTIFSKSPLDIIVENKKEGSLQNHLGKLTITQIQELERKTNTKLLDTWKKQQEEETYVGSTRFIKKNSRYYIECLGTVQEFTNFVIKIHKIIKIGDRYYQTGFVYYNDNETPFQLEDVAFRTSKTLMTALRKFFLNAGIGVPVILPNYSNYLVNVINRFNPDVVIDNNPVS